MPGQRISPDRRCRIEPPLLDCYHAALLAHGVSGYGRQVFDDDYRLSVLWQITRPVWQAALNIPPRVWWNNLERVLLAVDDLGCRDLLSLTLGRHPETVAEAMCVLRQARFVRQLRMTLSSEWHRPTRRVFCVAELME